MYLPIKFFTLLISIQILIAPISAIGQQNKKTAADSLRSVILKTTGKDRISALLDLSLEMLNFNPEEALDHAELALKESKSIGDPSLMLRSFYMVGRIKIELKKLDDAYTYLDTALQISNQINDDWNKCEILYRLGLLKFRKGNEIEAFELFNASIQAGRLSGNFKSVGSSYSIMGTIFRMNGLYDRAIEYIIKSKLNYQKADFTEGSGWTAYLLGRIYSDLKLTESALEHFEEALAIYTRHYEADGNQGGVALCYEQIGLLNIASGNFDEARKNFDLTMQIYSGQNSKDGMANANKNLGILEYYVGNFPESEKLLNKALVQKNQLGDFLSVPTIYEYLGLCMIKTGRQEPGFSHLQKGLDLAISNDQKKIQIDIYSKMAEAYLDLNNFKKAIASQKKQIDVQNLLLSGGAKIKLEQLQAIYEIDEKSEQIAELEKQNKINALTIKQNRIYQSFMILGIFLALFISGVIYWFYNKLRHKNQELFEVNAAKDKFFAIIAHDLRGPTSALAGLLDLLNTRFDDLNKKELKEMLLMLSKSAENVSDLLENLLIWTQSQLNKTEFRPQVLSLEDSVQQAMYSVKHVAEAKEIELRKEEKEDIFVIADADMLQIILRNLLSNAIKFTHRGGSVLVNPEVDGSNLVKICVTDNGVGIDKEQLKHIFELTNKCHTNGTENEKSTGLGLMLVKNFVEINKGTLAIESEKEKGTTVLFTLPVARVLTTEKQEEVEV